MTKLRSPVTRRLGQIRRGPTLRFKLVCGYALLLGSIASFMYLYFPSRLEREAMLAIAEKASTVAEMTAYGVSAALVFDDYAAVLDVFRGARQSPDVRYIVVTHPDGAVVSSFDLRAAKSAAFDDLGESATSADGMIYRTASPVVAMGDTIGTLYLGLSLERLQAGIARSRGHIAIVTLLVFGIGLLGVVGISLIVTGPLNRIVRVVERVSDGDLNQRVGNASSDEIGYLARAFDSMVEKLGAAYAELQAINRGLEERVSERTQELRREIDERMHAEEALKESEQRFRTMFEAAAVGIALVAPDETVIEVNPALLDMLGQPREQLVGQPIWDVMHEDDSAQAIAAFREILSGGEDRLHAEVQLRKYGARLWTHAVVSAVSDQDGRRRFGLAMFENITEQKELAERLRQAQKLEAIGRLAGGIAHDFNNLLTTINGVADLVLSDLDGEDVLREDIEQILHAGQRAASLTQQLLAFSRRQMLQPRVLDLNTAVTEMGSMLRRLIGEDVRLTLQLDSAVEPIRADPGQIGQVILNLVVNARDAMLQGGELKIETSEVILDESVAGRYGTSPGAYVMLTVTDTGHGMDEATQCQIFEPFFTTKEVGKGTGLGLATVYGIVTQSGGGIDVESEPGTGTTFRIVLPAVQDAEVVAEAPATLSLPRGTETLLLVEDEDGVRALVARVLRQTGYTVIESRDGSEAIQLVHSYIGRIHGVVTDVVMPNMSGPQLIDQLARLRPGLRVLYMSGYAREEIDQQGLSTGSIGFVQKPMSPRALATAVRGVLDSPAGLLRQAS